ncbi:uncharacterized protein LOC130894437 [Diorhabda carinulata]|uniref:uncharacterized protein LOC130894437 n=1 Tax=Diorhabda carinulata TaxID=1163345 RepID=UPI0025A15A6A|nr:uncharacterized protein LOC130894437 [Diorhabda carinulata]
MPPSFIRIFCYLGIFSEIFLVPVFSSIITCPKIHLENGTVKRRNRGKVVRFFCLRGYLLAGERYSTCIRGKWDPEPPRCVRPTCKAVNQKPGIENLLIYPTHSGAVQHFFCKAGYKLNGARDVYCDGDKWSDNMPTCLAVNEKPKLSCDFETTDLCGWTHDLNHDFDWRRENFKTPSGNIGTGPSFDHTKGPGQNGYYMYIESSSRTENDTARLISPVYDTINEEICFEFYYHMYGATIGTLRVYLKTINQSWNLQPDSAFFVKKGNQGNIWYRSYHYLGNITNYFQIVIEGIRGNGYVSDIAIDDVKIIPGCTAEDETTTILDTSTYNELFPTIDSCENRCDQKENESSSFYHLRCDCDQDCGDNNRCCPDFFDFCSGISDDGETSTTDVLTTEIHTTKALLPNRHVATTVLVNKSTTVYLFPTTKPTKKLTTYIPKIPKTTKKITTYIPKMPRPTVYLKTPTPPVIFRKTTSTRKPPSTKSTTYIPVKTVPPTPTKQSVTLDIVDVVDSEVNDEIDVPKPTNNDEPLYEGISVSKEYMSDEIENGDDAPFTSHFDESHKLFSQVQEKQPNTHLVIISVGICAAIIVTSALVFVAVKRYRSSRRIIHSSNGESQSDVRYLTSDDILDLSIANNYEELLLS